LAPPPPRWYTQVIMLRFILTLVLVSGCGFCGESAELRDGPHPYRACLSSDPPKSREVDLGESRLIVEGRRARYVSSEAKLRIAAFRGADDELVDLSRAVSAVDEESVDLIFVLGALGRERGEVEAHLEALSRTRRPLVLIPGGDDSLRALDDALGALSGEDRDRIVDGRRTSILEAGGREWLLVPGAPEGRYAYSSEACGFNRADLDARRADLRGDGHLTLAWASLEPSEELGREGVFAFRAGSSHGPSDRRIFVGPLAGPPYFEDGAYRRAAPTLLEVGPEGIDVRGTIAFRDDARMVRPPTP
jgi:hypothetical protein